MINNLDFLNKNIYRAYPIQQEATATAINGAVLPTYIVAAISLTIPIVSEAVDYQPYISQVAIINNILSVCISVVNIFESSTTISSIGYFSGLITNDFQSFTLNNFDNLSSGFLIIGEANSILSMNGIYTFNSPTQTGLEISTYIVFTPPAVRSLNYRNKQLTGRVNFGNLINITETNVDNTCTFLVKDNSQILSLGDKSSQFRNCGTPVITSINTTVPYPIADLADDANIYLFGVQPVVFYNDTDNSSIISSTVNQDLTPLTLTQFCTLNGSNLAPIDPNFTANQIAGDFIGNTNYYSKSQSPIVNFMTETTPEYFYWPQYIQTYNTVISYPSISSGNIIISPTGIKGVINQIYASVDVGSVTFTINITGTPITGLANLTAENSGVFTVDSINYTANTLLSLPTGGNTFGTTDNLTFDILSTTGGPTVFTLTVFYTQIFS